MLIPGEAIFGSAGNQVTVLPEPGQTIRIGQRDLSRVVLRGRIVNDALTDQATHAVAPEYDVTNRRGRKLTPTGLARLAGMIGRIDDFQLHSDRYVQAVGVTESAGETERTSLDGSAVAELMAQAQMPKEATSGHAATSSLPLFERPGFILSSLSRTIFP